MYIIFNMACCWVVMVQRYFTKIETATAIKQLIFHDFNCFFMVLIGSQVSWGYRYIITHYSRHTTNTATKYKLIQKKMGGFLGLITC